MKTSTLAFVVVAAIAVAAQAFDIHGHHEKYYETCETFTDMYKDVFLEDKKNEACYFLFTKRGSKVAKVCATMKNIFGRIDYKNPFKGKENCISFTFHALPGFLITGAAAGVSSSFKSAAKFPFQCAADLVFPLPEKTLFVCMDEVYVAPGPHYDGCCNTNIALNPKVTVVKTKRYGRSIGYYKKLRPVMAFPRPGKDDCKFVGKAVSCRVPLFCKYKIHHDDHHDDHHDGKDKGKDRDNGKDKF